MTTDLETAMPARNIHHAVVVRALTADGWTITHDPYPLSFGGKDLFVDLARRKPPWRLRRKAGGSPWKFRVSWAAPGAQSRRGGRAIRDLPLVACRDGFGPRAVH